MEKINMGEQDHRTDDSGFAEVVRKFDVLTSGQDDMHTILLAAVAGKRPIMPAKKQ